MALEIDLFRPRRARHRWLARARPRRRADARARRCRRRDRRHPRRVGHERGRRVRRPRAGRRRTGDGAHRVDGRGDPRARAARARRALRRHRPRAGRRGRRACRRRARLVDILVNNAGTLDHVGQFADQRLDLWERDLRVNLTGAFNCAQAVWPHMRERRVGPHREHGLGGRDARRLRPGELLDDEGRDPRPDEDARDGRRPARDHVQRDRARGSSAPRRSTWRTRP